MHARSFHETRKTAVKVLHSIMQAAEESRNNLVCSVQETGRKKSEDHNRKEQIRFAGQERMLFNLIIPSLCIESA